MPESWIMPRLLRQQQGPVKTSSAYPAAPVQVCPAHRCLCRVLAAAGRLCLDLLASWAKLCRRAISPTELCRGCWTVQARLASSCQRTVKNPGELSPPQSFAKDNRRCRHDLPVAASVLHRPQQCGQPGPLQVEQQSWESGFVNIGFAPTSVVCTHAVGSGALF